MFDVLARAKDGLRNGLLDPNDLSTWKSVDVNYHPPRVERLWRPFEDRYRLFLHCIHPCTVEEALLHPHLWASAMEVLHTDGVYRMLIGSSAGVEPPPVVTEIRFDSGQGGGFTYTMTHPDGWHAVVPEGGKVFTVMVTDLPWERQIPAVTEGVRGSLPGLSAARERELAQTFYDLLHPL